MVLAPKFLQLDFRQQKNKDNRKEVGKEASKAIKLSNDVYSIVK